MLPNMTCSRGLIHSHWSFSHLSRSFLCACNPPPCRYLHAPIHLVEIKERLKNKATGDGWVCWDSNITIPQPWPLFPRWTSLVNARKAICEDGGSVITVDLDWFSTSRWDLTVQLSLGWRFAALLLLKMYTSMTALSCVTTSDPNTRAIWGYASHNVPHATQSINITKACNKMITHFSTSWN